VTDSFFVFELAVVVAVDNLGLFDFLAELLLSSSFFLPPEDSFLPPRNGDFFALAFFFGSEASAVAGRTALVEVVVNVHDRTGRPEEFLVDTEEEEMTEVVKLEVSDDEVLK